MHVSTITTGSNFDAAVLVENLTQSVEIPDSLAPGSDHTVDLSVELFYMFAAVWDLFDNDSRSAQFHGTFEYRVLSDGFFKYVLQADVFG